VRLLCLLKAGGATRLSFFRITLVCALLLLASRGMGQYTVTGRVTDAQNGSPLAFANIIFNHSQSTGTTADIDGRFVIRSKQPLRHLTCSFIGYETVDMKLDTIPGGAIHIRLRPSDLSLTEVAVTAGENPAHRIIRQAIANKPLNNPENITSFKYTSYNKTIYDFKRRDTLNTDSILIKSARVFGSGHLMMMESVTERKFIAPDLSNETVLGTKVSGFRRPAFAALATDLQPFSFYKDIIPLFDAHYVNPLSGGSLARYRFTLQDTLYQDMDTVFIISFEPRARNFDGLTGVLYINTNRYAIQNVVAEPFEKGLIDIRIQQLYTFVSGQCWFPQQLNYEIIIRRYAESNVGISANGKSYISNVELMPALRRRDFEAISTIMDPQAADRDSLFWQQHRVKALDQPETVTYRVMDSIGSENKFDLLQDITGKISRNRLPIGFMDIDLSKTLVYNKFEGLRAGLGLYTNEKLIKWLSLGGYFGYGTKDRQWKYGGDATFLLSRKKEADFTASYASTLIEPGISRFVYVPNNYYDMRNYMTFRMDHVVQSGVQLRTRMFKYLRLTLGGSHAQVTPQYAYSFAADDTTSITSYTNCSLSAGMRFWFREKFVESLGQYVSTGSNYPVLDLVYSRGVRGFYGSRFDYNKMIVRLEYTRIFKIIGITRCRVEGGMVDRPLPYGLLFTGHGANDRDFPLFIRNYFQTAQLYEFLSDRYVNVFFSHNFDGYLFKHKGRKTPVTLHQSMGWGMLSQPASHQDVNFTVPLKGFFESGIQVDNILRANYQNIAYLGLGAGVFYRYGTYAAADAKSNFTVKVTLSYSTR
jgi:hypothetical protein